MNSEAERPAPANSASPTVLPSAVEIIETTFKRGRTPTDTDADERVNVQFDFAVKRLGPNAVGVRLTARTSAATGLSLEVTAQTALNLVVPRGEELDVDAHLAQIAGQLGPVVIYPYLREFIADVTRRAGLEPLTLPIVQVGRLFTVEPDEIQLKPEGKPPKKAAPKKQSKPKAPGKDSTKPTKRK